jgi:hypothetical protein
MLWGNKDYNTSNLKPLFANTTNTTSNSVINGSVANTNAYYGIVVGISPGEMNPANTRNDAKVPQHAGWNSIKIGTGPIIGISVSGGEGINSSGYLTITDRSVLAQGAEANISFTTANSQNTLQTYSTDPTLNTYGTLTIVNGGSGFSNALGIVVRTNGDNISLGTFTVTLGGRAGRMQTETLVAMGSMTSDDPRDNVFYTGV